jgi:ABC-type Mn2+/Zn2+ transport system ATPase subunit
MHTKTLISKLKTVQQETILDKEHDFTEVSAYMENILRVIEHSRSQEVRNEFPAEYTYRETKRNPLIFLEVFSRFKSQSIIK